MWDLQKHFRKEESCSGGDNAKDDDGCKAMFTEQGASASQMALARFLDTTARLLGMAREDNEAVSAYTQVHMSDAPRLLRFPEKECPQLWIRLPPRRRRESWDSLEEPVVPFERNLHGHLVAGLLEKEVRTLRETTGKSCLFGSVFTSTENHNCSCPYM